MALLPNPTCALTLSFHRRCMPSSICPDGPEPWCNISSGPDGDGIRTPGHTGQTRNLPRGTAALQADMSQACPCVPFD